VRTCSYADAEFGTTRGVYMYSEFVVSATASIEDKTSLVDKREWKRAALRTHVDATQAALRISK